MMKFALAAAVATMFLLPGQASAQSQSTVAAPAITDISSQTVVKKKTVVRPGGRKTTTVVRRPAKRTVVVRPGVRTTVVRPGVRTTVVRRPAAKVCRTVKSTRIVNGRRVTSTTRRCK